MIQQYDVIGGHTTDEILGSTHAILHQVTGVILLYVWCCTLYFLYSSTAGIFLVCEYSSSGPAARS